MPAVDPLIGQRISHYRIVEKLGGGGMGVVYKAEDTRLKRFVALKFLPPDVARDPQSLARFQREAQAASALNHPNICTIYDIGEQESQAFIAMEFLEGMTLKHRINGTPLDTDSLLPLAIEISYALDAAHSKGIVHRDIKPANIFITARGHAKILDFGLATGLFCHPRARSHRRRQRSGSNQSGVHSRHRRLHVPRASSCQGVRRTLRPVFFWCGPLRNGHRGTLPFRGESSGVIFKSILDATPTPAARLNPDLPPKLEDVILKCLEKDCNLRYQHAADLRTDLQRV